MPRKTRNAGTNSREPYRPDQADAMARIDDKRVRLGVTIAALAGQAGLSERTLRRMLKSGRGWPRHVRALTFALRTIEAERRTEAKVLT